MIPFFPEPAFRVGVFTLYAFGALAILAILTGYWIILRRARRAGVDPVVTQRLTYAVIAGGFVGGITWSFAAGHPGISTFGCLAGGLGAFILYSGSGKMPRPVMLRYLDAVAFALPSALLFGRLGCALAHDHRGAYTSSVLGVRFPEGTRFDLGLIEFLFLACLVPIFFTLARRACPDGLFTALFSFTYATFRLSVEPLRFDSSPFALDPVRIVLALAAAGAIVFLWRCRVRTALERL